MRKNDEIVLDIIDLSNEGLGIGKVDGFPIFVKGAIIGDRIRAGITKLKKNFGYARILSIIEPSAYRTVPVCPVASRCGGCQLQHMKYENQLEYKNDKVKKCLTRLGGIKLDDESVEFRDIIGMENPWNYRNKAQFPVGTDAKNNISVGFYAEHTHGFVDIDSCAIQHRINDFLLKDIKDFISFHRSEGNPSRECLTIYDEKTQKGLIRHILTRVGFTTGEVMVCFVINGDRFPQQEKLTEVLLKSIDSYNKQYDEQLKLHCIAYNINKENTNVILGEKVVTIYGEPYIHDYIGSIRYQISPLSFYQVNPVQTNRLYSTALEFAGLTGNEVVWDIYCGIGTISLFLAQKAKQVYGVEIVPQAVEDAKANALINGINNTEFFAGAAEEVVPQMYEENPETRADVIVVDPPRKGCATELLSTIIKLAPERIVYVSCDPATLARDIKYLKTEGNYQLRKVQPVDMFPGGCHVECVVLMSKVKK